MTRFGSSGRGRSSRAPPRRLAPALRPAPTTPPAAGDRNLSFERAPTSLPSDLGTYREGLERLGVIPSTGAGAEWNGTFTPEQWAALIAKGKARLASCPGTPAAAPRPHTATPHTRAEASILYGLYTRLCMLSCMKGVCMKN